MSLLLYFPLWVNISLDTMKRPNEKDMTVIAENYLRTKHVRNSAQRFVRIETSY